MSLSHSPVPPLDDSLFVSLDVPAGRVRLTGELDHGSAHLLVDALPVLAAGRSPSWSVDATAVTFCDGGGLTALVRARDLARTEGRSFLLVGASRCVRRLIGVAGLDDLLPVIRVLS